MPDTALHAPHVQHVANHRRETDERSIPGASREQPDCVPFISVEWLEASPVQSAYRVYIQPCEQLSAQGYERAQVVNCYQNATGVVFDATTWQDGRLYITEPDVTVL